MRITMRRIGIIGVGLLGSAVASRLLAKDFRVTGYDTRPAQLTALQGLTPATSAAAAVDGADAVFTILPTPSVADSARRQPAAVDMAIRAGRPVTGA